MGIGIRIVSPIIVKDVDVPSTDCETFIGLI